MYIIEGKSLMLKKAHDRLHFNRDKNGRLDCYGTEESAFLCLFAAVWKLQLLYQCTANSCPTEKKIKTRYQTTFSLPKNCHETQSIFPLLNDRMGYCGAY